MSNFIIDFISGVLGGVANCVSGHFMDTVKVRMQINPNSSTVSGTLYSIIKNQGWLQLFSGLYYPLITSPIVNSLVFVFYEQYKRLRKKENYTILDGLQNGAVAGCLITFVSTPFELVKCKMQYEPTRFAHSRDCMKHIVKTSGLKGMYKGNFSLLMRQVLGYSAFFGLYQYIKGFFITQNHKHLSLSETLIVGPLTAMIGWVFSYPQDVIKTIIQVDELNKYKRLKYVPDGGFFNCGKQIYQKQGIKGFFVGISPCLIRAAYSDGIGIVVYEKSREYFCNKRFDYLQL